MGNGNIYHEKRDIRAIAVLLAAQGMIRLGEVPDPLSGTAEFNAEGAGFFIELLAELQRKTRGNLSAEEEAFLGKVLESMREVFRKKSAVGHG